MPKTTLMSQHLPIGLQLSRSWISAILPPRIFKHCVHGFCTTSGESTYKTLTIRSQGADVRLGYYDSGPKDGPVVLGVHGHPGVASDYEPLFSPLAAHGIRMVTPDQPGYRNSEVLDKKISRVVMSAKGVSQLMQDFLAAINIPRVAMVLGHSIGGHPVYSLCTHSDITSSMVLINVGGHLHHRVSKPYWYVRFGSWAIPHPVFGKPTEFLLKRGYKARGFNVDDMEALKTAIRYSGNLQFEHIAESLPKLREKVNSGKLGVTFFHSRTDRPMEWEICFATAKELGMTMDDVSQYDADLKHSGGPTADEDRNPKFFLFDKGGHSVHKVYPDFVSDILVKLVKKAEFT